MAGGGKTTGRTDSSAAGLGIPPGFRNATLQLGKKIFAPFINDPRFAGSLTGQGGALDFYDPSNPGGLNLARGVYEADIADPTKLTDPLFLQQREKLGAELVERSRQTGGLYSSAANTMVGEGLGQFTNQYLSDAYQRRGQAAGNLMNLGQAMFTPFQALTGAMGGLIGRGTPGAPRPYSNKTGEILHESAKAYGASKSMGNPY